MMYSEEESVSFDTDIYLTTHRGCLLLSTLRNQMLNPMAGNIAHHKRGQLKYRHMEGEELSHLSAVMIPCQFFSFFLY